MKNIYKLFLEPLLMEQTISLCMIVRDEALYLEKCLETVHSFVSEIIIVDTGSCDQTMSIAKKWTNKVFSFSWNDDFSAARNYAIRQATSDWILVLDADELLAPKDCKKIQELVKNTKASAYFFTQKEYTNDTSLTGFHYSYNEGFLGYVLVTHAIRLFRHLPFLHFHWKIHESILPSLEKNNIIPLDSNIFIHHYKQKKDKTTQQEKLQKYLRIGELQCQETPNKAKPWYELGLIYYAMKKYQEAATAFERVQAILPDDTRSLFKLGRTYAKLSLYQKAMSYFQMHLQKAGKTSETFGELGLLSIKQQQYAAAKKCFLAALEVNSADILVRHNLSLLYLHLGETEQALLLLHETEEKYPNQWTYNTLGILAAEKKQFKEARSFFDKGIALDPSSSCEMTFHLQKNREKLKE